MTEIEVAPPTHRTSARASGRPLSVRDQAQLFTLWALALLVSYLGQLALAAALTALPLGSFVVLLVRTSVAQDLAVLVWVAISGTLFLFGAGRLARMKPWLAGRAARARN